MVKIEVLKNGPLYITGDIEIVDAQENPIPLRTPGKAVLCRCGRSKDKPFCDGSHKQTGWSDEG
ncbi:MAG: CDGSH iron-sulfur domain-containing protein [Chthonomonadales bacterium]|nr:CDGSH iron-sulfur domain-containing protein [Chthonomonadales bacterium]